MKIISINKTIILALSFLVSFAHAQTLEFPKSGFSITGLDSVPNKNVGAKVIQMFLPPQNGFAANVNVVIQPYTGTMKEYKKLSEAQFKQTGLTLLSIKQNDNSVSFEYTGVMQGILLKWYSIAHKKENIVYLITATSPKIDWEKNKKKLINSVNSFKLK